MGQVSLLLIAFTDRRPPYVALVVRVTRSLWCPCHRITVNEEILHTFACIKA